MKVIFLDHDGVICLSSNWGSRFKKQRKVYTKDNPRPLNSEVPIEFRFDDFDKKSVKILNEILEKTDAEIVVSSDWRFHCTLEQMQELYKIKGIKKIPIAFTTSTLPKDTKIHNWQTEPHETRSLEILQWLSEHPEVTHWVAVDDLYMGEKFEGDKYIWGLKNFVWTVKSNEGIKQSGIKDKIINLLK